MQTSQYFILNEKTQPQKKSKKYLSGISIFIIAALVYLNSYISYETTILQIDNPIPQLLIFFIFCLIWFGIIGLKLSNAVFAVAAFGPTVLLEGYGYINTPFSSLSLIDLMIMVSIILSLIRKTDVVWSGYIKYSILLFGICLISTIMTFNFALFGTIFRLSINLFFIIIIFSSKNKEIKAAFVDGLLITPIIALSYLLGINGLWRFISFDNANALDVYNTGEVLYGSHQVVVYLLFLIPLFMYFGWNKFLLPLIILIIPYIIFSMSRSLVLSVGLTFLIFIFLNIKNISMLIFSILILVGIIIGVAKMGFFSFSDDGAKAGSNLIRFAKMNSVWETFKKSPIIGVGYGTAMVLDSKSSDGISGNDSNFLDIATDKKTSSEFTPLQILGETGSLGGLTSILLIVFSFKCFYKALKSGVVPKYVHFVLYGWLIIFITIFIGQNAFNSMIILLATPVAAYETYLKK
jgi:hypothetical protein